MLTVKQAQQQNTQKLLPFSDTARMDVDILLGFCLDKTRVWLITWPEVALTAQQLADFMRCVERRIEGEPIAYIVGEQEFWSLPFKVNAHTLIPRPETELLVELALERKLLPDASVLDLGTGSGAIPLALKSERPLWQVKALDLSQEAIDVARANGVALSLDVDFVTSDWFSMVHNETFDLIISNPPYIDPQDAHLSQGDVRFEPDSALVADESGYGDIRRICEAAMGYLRPDGVLMFEHGFEQGEGVRSILSKNGFQGIETINDLAGLERVTLGCRGVK